MYIEELAEENYKATFNAFISEETGVMPFGLTIISLERTNADGQ